MIRTPIPREGSLERWGLILEAKEAAMKHYYGDMPEEDEEGEGGGEDETL